MKLWSMLQFSSLYEEFPNFSTKENVDSYPCDAASLPTTTFINIILPPLSLRWPTSHVGLTILKTFSQGSLFTFYIKLN